MSAGLLIALALAAAAAGFIVAPLLRRDAAEAERVGAAVSEERDLRSRHEMLLAALKDLEDDRATGKIDDADYAQQRGDLAAQAVEIMKQLDALDEARARSTPVALPDPDRGLEPRGPAA